MSAVLVMGDASTGCTARWLEAEHGDTGVRGDDVGFIASKPRGLAEGRKVMVSLPTPWLGACDVSKSTSGTSEPSHIR